MEPQYRSLESHAYLVLLRVTRVLPGGGFLGCAVVRCSVWRRALDFALSKSTATSFIHVAIHCLASFDLVPPRVPLGLLPSVQVLNAALTRTCFTVSYTGCDTSLPCCQSLLGSLDKLVFETTEQCGTKANIVGVAVNNAPHASWNTYSHTAGG